MKKFACFCVMLLLASHLAACGQKGPLTRPDAANPATLAAQHPD